MGKRRPVVHIRSKWAKTKAILCSRELGQYVPRTQRLSQSNLRQMLSRYRMVYVKPDAGTYGNGVMKLGFTHDGAYYCRDRDRIRHFPTLASLYRAIRIRSGGRRYLVQRGIHLLKYRGRLFDIRVMVQRNAQRQWETTGMIGRAARPSYIVTNYHSGGRPMDIRALLAPHLDQRRVRSLSARMSSIGRKAASALGKAYPGVNMVGADIGLDDRLNCWIIELNTSPDPYIFRFLKDRSVSRRVLRYARALGRIPH